MHRWRPLTRGDYDDYIAMVTAFYSTDAVIKPIPRAHMDATFEEVLRSDAYTSCYICETDGEAVGYALLAHTFSQEAGGKVMWIEELYLKEEHRHQGYGRSCFKGSLSSLPADVKRVRLEVERDNEGAVKLYKSFGFDFLEYDQMVLDR